MARSSIPFVASLIAVLGLLVGSLASLIHAAQPAVVPLSPEMITRVLNPTEVVAIVGDQRIFAGDLLPMIDQMLADAVKTMPPGQRDQLARQRAMMIQQMLPRKIEIKLVLLDFYRSIPEDKLKEVLGNIDKQVGKQFYAEQAPKLQEQLGVEFLTELESKLHEFGTSIEAQKAEFREQMIARTMIGQSVDRSSEITHDQLLEYFHEHTKDYDIQARAQWEKLTVLFAKFPDKVTADQAIVAMGNQVLRGADFAAVAKKSSQGTNALEGGFHDWTTQGSLVSEVLDHAIFTLPLHRLSKRLEDQRGFHIIRVLAREEAGRVSFKEAQDEIRQQLQAERRKRQIREYVDELREKTYVWTFFDEPSK